MATSQYFRYPPLGFGTVISVGLSLPGSVFSVSGSPVGGTGTLTGSFINQSANTVFAGPTGGGPGTPSFRALVAADLPAGTGTVTNVTASAPLSSTGGATPNISITLANSTTDGYLSSVDWNTFNNKQPAGNYITALTGDATAAGPGSVALTLATVNGNVGSFGTATDVGSFTVNAKGLITAASNTPIQIAEAQVTNLVSDLAGKQATGNYITALTGDVTATGPGSVAASLVATTNSTLTTLSALSLPGSQVTGNISGNAANVTGTVAASNGGTGQTSLTLNNVLLGNGTSPVQFVAPGTSGNVLTSNGTTWLSSPPAGSAPNVPNNLLNSAFDLWQRGTSVVIVNASSVYQADRWYVSNTLGTDGEITYSQIAGTLDGSKYATQVQITQAPTAGQNNGTEFFQTLENSDSLRFYNKTASSSINIKALGNVTQVGIQFMYNTTEAKVNTTIGSEVLVTVSTGAFTLGSILSQAIGTSQTTSGVIGFRVRITAVSSGNTYDLNNGYILEQGMMNLGTTVGSYQRLGGSLGEELEACQRFYEKSYDITVNPGTVTMVGQWELYQPNTTGTLFEAVPYHVSKRVSVSPIVYSPNSGSANNIYNLSAPADVGVSSITVFGMYGFSQIVLTGSVNTNQVAQWHWINDAEI